MSGPDLLLPEGAVLLHIGPRKTGTTSVQAGLSQARDQLAAYGAAYPAVPRHPQRVRYDRRRAASPSWAVTGAAAPGFPVPDMAVWEEFAQVVRDHTAQGLRTCVSSETFGRVRSPARLERIVADLGGENVYVLATSRALHKLLPSHWQQLVQVNLNERSYEDWLRVVFGPDERAAAREFWIHHDIGMAMKAWVNAVGPARFTLTVTDDSDHSVLPDAVAAMLGIPPELLQATTLNQSRTPVETEVLRRLNHDAREQHWSTSAFTMLQRGARKGMKSNPPADAVRGAPPMPSWAVPLVEERSRAQRTLIEGLGVRVLGDPECLLPPAGPSQAGQEPAVLDAVPIETAVGAVSGTMRAAYSLDERRRRELAELRRSYDAAVAQRVRRAPLRELVTEILKRPARRLRGRAEEPTDWAAQAPTPPPVEITDPIPGREER